ncbi:alpha carbonic anhydrase 1, chloroplastic-like isoform X2 [Salvia hispanica]|uniref:alpha carbonic anhydrase 1, chloroplastic-like isoform X2 n=1 Tax=Salvia hispanica TaxID=49212 RepID=UPI00200977C5|nr:alpha carbonic anhydrase 1, chloroplastic-like isoform X2 [Salvia hispanica]
MAARFGFFTWTISLLIILGSNAFTTSTSEVEETLQFTYSGATGPDKWASLNPNFSLCATGKLQSPINIVSARAVRNSKWKPLIRNYRAVNVTLVDNKFTVAIEYPDDSGEISLDEKQYRLKQMHWHSPSEHRVNGNRFAAELHMVHVSDDGKVLVVATLFQLGRPDPVLQTIDKKLYELGSEYRSSEATAPIQVGVFHPAELRTSLRKYYKYTGSSSVPPCTEHLIYLVIAKPRYISKQQVAALKAPLDIRCKNNARPCQPLNARHVHLYQD